jgi:hypothetical protein
MYPPQGAGTIHDIVETISTTAMSTTSTTYVDMTGISVSVTVGSGEKVLLIFYSNLMCSASDYAWIALLRDTTILRGREVVAYWPGANMFHRSIILVDAPAAGTYTYKAQWKTKSGTLYNTNSSDAASLTHLIAIRLRK